MTTPSGTSRNPWGTWAAVLARLILGGVFLYMGLNKALDPVGFLKLVRQYDLVHGPPWINLVAVTVPWLEAFCGALLVAGVAVRGTALLALAMLVPFTALVIRRALEIQAATGSAFCAIRFDCGCGAGEVWICAKIVENTLLTLLALFLTACRSHRWAARPFLLAAGTPGPAREPSPAP